MNTLVEKVSEFLFGQEGSAIRYENIEKCKDFLAVSFLMFVVLFIIQLFTGDYRSNQNGSNQDDDNDNI